MSFDPDFPTNLLNLLPEDIVGVYRLNRYEWSDTIGAFQNAGGIVVIPREDRASKWVQVYPSPEKTAWEIMREAFERFGQIPPMSATETRTETINRMTNADGNTNQPSGTTGVADPHGIRNDGTNPGEPSGRDRSQTGGQSTFGFIPPPAQSGIGSLAGGANIFAGSRQNAPRMGSGGNPSWFTGGGGMEVTVPEMWPTGIPGGNTASPGGGGLGGNFGFRGGYAPPPGGLGLGGNPPPPTGNPGGNPGNPAGGNPGGGNPGGPPGGGGAPPQAQANPQPPVQNPYYKPPMIKINPPDIFDGERSDMQNFINQCNSWFTMYETLFQNDVQRVIFILSYISNKGKMGQWKQNYHRVHTDPTTRRFFPPSLTQFDTDFQRAFRAVQEIQKA
ncbi:hypothetical protein WOLCODRAFT_156172 [Wolfiporia cocos MD-104 SS10]|uniref:DUF4939 domain-containing protein n=1 Tax=Wolfiporia cocos (strain MD-104) TaxID=742152 RepID=A0A2H3IZX0_WOLCO|nr:hypothetical protein WOLCODRAFT_156172 [Wolfiporia cocos MD-104 SS10]